MRLSTHLRWTLLLSLAAAAWAALLGAALWSLLAPELQAAAMDALREQVVAVLGLFGLLLPVGIGLLLKPWAAQWPQAAAKMSDAVDIIAAGNPAHRLDPRGGAELAAMARSVNALAERHAALQRDVQQQVQAAQAQLAQETARLAALMAELPEGVLLCRADGQVLLYNDSAARTLADDAAPLGLGRPVTDWFDAGAIAHALQRLQAQIDDGAVRPSAHVVVARRGGAATQLLRGQLVPLRSGDAALDGYLLILSDLTRQVQEASRRDRALLELTEGSRSALASLRAAAEMLLARPQMDGAMRQRFVQVIHDEAQQLSRRLEEARSRGGDPLAGAWPREDMRAADLAGALRRNLAALPLALEIEPGDTSTWLHLDSHALVQALSHLAGEVRSALGIEAMRLRWSEQGGLVALDLLWSGLPLEPGQLAQWEAQPFGLGEQGVSVSLREVLERHGAEAWSLGAMAAGIEGHAGIRVQLPAAGAATDRDGAAATAPSRPVYYDFALLKRGGDAALQEQPLAELIFTVFDTETTGLKPSEGDEIISIGAYRIVGQRLLEHECFERLIEPRRPVRESAQAVHGISQAMLAGQPTAEVVLPAFARFCAGSVLVAHNAAFDLRFLDLARERTGAGFDQPVLDTLLLSSVLHPGHGGGEHRLEAIAERLGIEVVGRHTALGDAWVTGQVFLRMLPLLAARGILTLGQALQASEGSAYAQLRY